MGFDSFHGNHARDAHDFHSGHGHRGHNHRHGRDHGGGSQHDKDSTIALSLLGTFDSGLGEAAAEIVAHDPQTQRLFVTNAEAETVDILDISDPKHPTKVGSIDVGVINGVETGGPNSVAVGKGIIAVAVEGDNLTDPGLVAFYDADGNFLGSVGAVRLRAVRHPDRRQRRCRHVHGQRLARRRRARGGPGLA
jgi:hypothetical protein